MTRKKGGKGSGEVERLARGRKQELRTLGAGEGGIAVLSLMILRIAWGTIAKGKGKDEYKL